MDDVSAAWAAGLFEGEGSIVFTGVNSVAVTVFMTDEDVIRSLFERVGAGTVRGPYLDRNRPTSKPIWKWSIAKGSHAEEFLTAIRPWMGARRQERIDAALERLSHQRGRERCQQGHDNWRPQVGRRGGRYCLDCSNIRQRLRRSADRSQLNERAA